MFLQAKAHFVETFLSKPIRAGENNHFKLRGNDQAGALHSAVSAPKETGQTVIDDHQLHLSKTCLFVNCRLN